VTVQDHGELPDGVGPQPDAKGRRASFTGPPESDITCPPALMPLSLPTMVSAADAAARTTRHAARGPATLRRTPPAGREP